MTHATMTALIKTEIRRAHPGLIYEEACSADGLWRITSEGFANVTRYSIWLSSSDLLRALHALPDDSSLTDVMCELGWYRA